jgi:hypothetical protein
LFERELRQGRRNLRPVRHDGNGADTEPAPAPLEPRDPDEDGPGDGIIGYRDRRLLNTAFCEYEFDLLDFVGKWNSDPRAPNLFVSHLGIHFNERKIKVSMPATLVAELMDWWTNRARDMDWENFNLSVARSRILVSELAITADQQYLANLYGPAIAFQLSYDKQQNVARVVRGAHLNMRMYTLPKLQAAQSTMMGRFLIGVSGVVLASASLAVLMLVRSFLGRKPGRAPPA